MPTQIPAHVFTVMCEDIRQEEHGKASILGMYSENIFFKEMPMTMRSLAFFSRFLGGNGVFRVSIKLKGPTTDLIPGLEIPNEARFPQSKDSELSTLGLVIGNIEFKEQGLHQYEIYFGNTADPIIRLCFKVSVRPEIFSSLTPAK